MPSDRPGSLTTSEPFSPIASWTRRLATDLAGRRGPIAGDDPALAFALEREALSVLAGELEPSHGFRIDREGPPCRADRWPTWPRS
jgi:hypothetical protein